MLPSFGEHAQLIMGISSDFVQPDAPQALLGSRQRVHDIFRKKRRLSLEHVRALHNKLLSPADVLIQAY